MQFPKWIHRVSALSMTVAILFLALGVLQYARFALAEPGVRSWYGSFFWCMTALFFFNFPIVLKKRHARRQLTKQRPSER